MVRVRLAERSLTVPWRLCRTITSPQSRVRVERPARRAVDARPVVAPRAPRAGGTRERAVSPSPRGRACHSRARVRFARARAPGPLSGTPQSMWPLHTAPRSTRLIRAQAPPATKDLKSPPHARALSGEICPSAIPWRGLSESADQYQDECNRNHAQVGRHAWVKTRCPGYTP